MASNHVHLDKHQPGQQLAGNHNNLFQPAPHDGQWNQNQNQNQNQNHDQRHYQNNNTHQNVPRPGSAWQQQHQQPTLPAAFDSNPLYGRGFSDSPAPFPSQSLPVANHGAIRQQFDNHQQQAALDPALMTNSSAPDQQYDSTNPMYPPHATTQTTLVAPKTIQSPYGPNYQHQHKPNVPSQLRDYSHTPPTANAIPSTPVANFPPAPTPVQHGNFLMVDYDALKQATDSTRLHEFVNIGNNALDLPTMKSALPAYQPRRSKNELKKLAASDSRLAGEITKATKKAKSPAEKLMRTKSPSGTGSPATIKDETDSSSETETSSDDSEYDSSEDEVIPEPSPLPAVRPTEMLQRVRYDTMKALWRPRNLPANAVEIRKALKDYWEILSTIRNRWKGDQQSLKDAEQKKMRDLDQLKDRVKDQRDQMEMAIKCALQYGHPGVIRTLGANTAFLFAAYQFLADRIRDNEYNDLFSKAILELLARCENILYENLEKTKLIGALKRYLTRGDERTKVLAQRIVARAKENSKKNGGNDSEDSKKSDVKKEPEASKTSQPSTIAGVKRPRPADGASAVPVKKTVTSTNGSSAAAKLASASGVKKPGLAASTPSSSSGAASAASKPKMAPKPSLFPGLQSASKKSAITNGQKPTSTTAAAAAAAAAVKKPVPIPAAPRFSFAETMANLTKPKEEKPVVKPEENRPPESDEERAKRIRKEQRRRLKVKWVDHENAGQLVSVRLFTHDPEEELGHDAAMVRDVDDVGGEGRMFKQHKDMMDLDEDDDRPNEEDVRTWACPSFVDFANVPLDEKSRNYEPYGGGALKPESPEKAVQEQHEANTLLVFYTSSADVPPNPREPPAEEVEQKEPLLFGTPPELVLERASKFAPAPAAETPSTEAGAPNISHILALLSSTSQQQQPQPGASQTVEKTFSMFSQPQQQPAQPQPPAPVTAEAQSKIDIQAILANLGNMSAQQPQQAQAQPPQPPQQNTAFSNMPMTMPNMSSMPTIQNLSGFDLGAMFGAAASSGAAPSFGVSTPPQAPTESLLPPQQQAFDEERNKRGRDGSNDGRDGNFKKGKKWRGGRGPSGEYVPPQFILPCRFWKEGKCIKGEKCTYLHE
ncbi:hypothetical protein IWX90DRAFT_128954 [Phyllosticta citrichinensis]|uniref:C3H1-type domain-containing protein n=1 Tax=Phyllosticta citrichinensis TaxID=1130410 RepID=A0ABR1Y4C7_9PEZI